MFRIFKTKVIDPLLHLLKQGVSPQKLALATVIGMGMGVMPVLGVTTMICAGLAFLLRLNMVAIQVVNYAMYPLQLMLFLPFLQAGANFMDVPLALFSIEQVLALFDKGWLVAGQQLGGAVLGAVLVWSLTVPLVAFLLYFVLVMIYEKALVKLNSK
ncbi:DUF2062 domain-containing protein [Rapidithrix thailandica]|uniref:DUF2062 domain-containing protein n=1 Tax=Rapidithrix thailandica TaxID=413964 RepID=A0AAW9SER4_9BACT